MLEVGAAEVALTVGVAIHHCPDWATMPTNPSAPLKRAVCTSTQVTPVLQVAHNELVNDVPVLAAVHHWPDCRTRPVMSARPSPLKSPTWTST